MECGNDWATMDVLDMVHVSYFGDFLTVGSRVSFEHNMLCKFRAAKKSLQAGPHLKAAAHAGLAA